MKGVLAALAAVAALAGCSSGEPPAAAAPAPTVAARPAAEVLAAAREAVLSAETVHVRGDWDQNTAPEGAYRLDVWMHGATGGKGWFTLDGDNVDLVRIGRQAWLRGSVGYFRAVGYSKKAAETIWGWYLEVRPADRPWAELIDPFTTVSSFSRDWLTPPGAVADAGTKEFGGVPCRGLRYTEDGDEVTVYVPTTGPPRPTWLTRTGHLDGSLTMDGYDVPFDNPRPPADETVRVSDR